MKVRIYPIIGIPVAAVTYDQIIELIKIKVARKERFLISPAPAYTLVKAFFDQDIKLALQSFDLIVPDGQWVRWALNLLFKQKLPDRVYGPELMNRVIKLAEAKKWSVFFYGSTNKNLSRLKVNIKEKFLNLIIAGKYAPRFKQKQSLMRRKLVSMLVKAKPKILFVSLGSPKQDVFLADLINSDSMKLPVVAIPVGAAFNYISKVKAQAPLWMQRSGLESLFRFLKEPKRLWKRYLLFSPIFVLLVLFQKTLALANIGNRKPLIVEISR